MELRLLVVVVLVTEQFISHIDCAADGSRHIHGNHHERNMRWDHWTDWSTCSAECGTGVIARSRDCRSMIDGSRTEGCHGVSKQTKLCSMKPCIVEEKVQACRDLDQSMFSGRRYRWEPYTHPVNKCELACRAVGHGFYKGLARSMKDGTRCDRHGKYVCIEGVCKTYGCDNVIDSHATTDRCGVCKGDNSTCDLISQIYTDSSKTYGYSTVVTIPAGARHINITELKGTRNYLVLQQVRGPFRLNTDWRLSRRGNHSGVGTNFFYRHRYGTWCPGECITAKGPTTSAIELKVLFYTKNEGVAYSYSLPSGTVSKLDLEQQIDDRQTVRDSHRQHRRHKPRKPIFSHDFTFMKNKKYRQRINSENKNTYDLRSEVTAGKTDVKSPIIVEDAFENDPYATVTAEKVKPPVSDNKSPDDDGGKSDPVIVEKDYTGMYLSENVTVKPVEVDEGPASEEGTGDDQEENPNELLPEDSYSRDTDLSYLYSWRVSGYTECSATCGEGKQTSVLECIATNKGKAVDESYCRNVVKPAEEVLTCSYRICPPSWRTDPWSKCSVTCGSGFRTRNVVCESSGGATLDYRKCYKQKPETSETCDLGSCVTGWFFTDWQNTCPVECGDGIQTRKVHCVGKIDNRVDSSGPAGSCRLREMPSSERTCQASRRCQTGGTWFTGPWGMCNATCGMAYQTRTVVCVKKRTDGNPFQVVPNENCIGEEQPPTYMSCDLEPCDPEWFMTEWSECSVTCGSGQRTRSVKCLDAKKTASADCDTSIKPPTTETCRQQRECSPADQETSGIHDKDCQDTFVRCDMVIRANLCRYRYYDKICCQSCSKAARY